MPFVILIDLYEQKLEQLDRTTEQLLRNSQKLFSVKMIQLEQLDKADYHETIQMKKLQKSKEKHK